MTHIIFKAYKIKPQLFPQVFSTRFFFLPPLSTFVFTTKLTKKGTVCDLYDANVIT